MKRILIRNVLAGAALALLMAAATAVASKPEAKEAATKRQKEYEKRNDEVCGCPGPKYVIDWKSFSGKDFAAKTPSAQEIAMSRAGDMPFCMYQDAVGRICSDAHKAIYCKRIRGVVITTRYKSGGGASVVSKDGKAWDAFIDDGVGVECRTPNDVFLNFDE